MSKVKPLVELVAFYFHTRDDSYWHIGSSHQPNASLPEAGESGASGLDKKMRKEPPGGKINFPSKDLAKLIGTETV